MKFIRASRKDGNYVNLSTKAAYDKNLSNNAVGLYFRLASLPEDFVITAKGLQTLFKLGRYVVESALTELVENGYLLKDAKPNFGYFKGYDYTLFEEKQNLKEPDKVGEIPLQENNNDKKTTEEPSAGNLHITNNSLYNNINNNYNNNLNNIKKEKNNRQKSQTKKPKRKPQKNLEEISRKTTKQNIISYLNTIRFKFLEGIEPITLTTINSKRLDKLLKTYTQRQINKIIDNFPHTKMFKDNPATFNLALLSSPKVADFTLYSGKPLQKASGNSLIW